MAQRLIICLSVILIAVPVASRAGDDAKKALEGVWIGESMIADGKPVPAADAARMRFAFRDGKLFLKGNFNDDREEECTYRLDAKQSPKHFDFTPKSEKESILGIYAVKGDVLTLCLRHEKSRARDRPTEFSSKPGSDVILLVWKKQKARDV